MVIQNLADVVYTQAYKYGTRTVLQYRDNKLDKWQKISWIQFAEKVALTSKALIQQGVNVQENIGLYSPNMAECFFVDYGGYGVRAVSVPMYATASPDQIRYILNDANIRFLFVGEQLQYNNAYAVQQEGNTPLERIVIFDGDVLKNPTDTTSLYFEEFLRLGDNTHNETEVNIRRNQVVEEDIATIIYTSGTTGESKGVVLPHSCFIELLRIHSLRLPMVNNQDISVAFLPLNHVFEKAWSYFCVHKGCRIAINKDPREIQKTLPEVHPTLMCNVPRFWEKVYAGVNERIEHAPSYQKTLFRRAIKAGARYILDYRRQGLSAPFWLTIQFKFYDLLAFNMLKKVLGIDKGRLFPVAGAPLSDEICRFLLSVNLPIKYGYGLSETTATVAFFPEVNYQIGSIGTIMPDLQVKIDPENDEILVKGKTITSGYYNKPKDTAEAFTEDGFFRTGDAGRLDGNTLYFKERIKDLFKTSNGKYIAPQSIEITLTEDIYIEQCVAIADQYKFVSALIIPSAPMIEKYAEEKNIPYENLQDLLKKEEIYRFIQSRIEAKMKNFSPYERVKRFTLLARPLSMENGELTNTLKLKRNVINEHYATEIAAMYAED